MDNCVPEAVCRERTRVQEERFSRDRERLEKVEKRLDDVEDEQSDAGKALLKLTTMEEQDRERLNDHDKRIETLESRRSVLWDKFIFGAISALVSGGVAIASNYFS